MKKYKWLVPTLYIIFLMLPIYWLINMSFKTTTEIINTYSLWPREFTTENYVKIFTDSTWYMGYVNSITYTVYGSTERQINCDQHIKYWRDDNTETKIQRC